MPVSMLKIASFVSVSETNGPGLRAVLWMQGCKQRCPGCFNPDFQPFSGGVSYTPEALYTHLEKETDCFSRIEGITLSGGEPFEQAAPLLPFVRAVRKAGLSVMAFSGYRLEDITMKGGAGALLLKEMDILVDGEYIEHQAVQHLWRSSANQRVHFLTPRYANYENKIGGQIKEYEVIIEPDATLQITGFPIKN